MTLTHLYNVGNEWTFEVVIEFDVIIDEDVLQQQQSKNELIFNS